MSLPNLVQLVCNEGREACLRIAKAGETGEVYFAEGNVVHAAAEGRTGEEAVTALARWAEGDFELEYEVTAPAQTIVKNWSSLLLAALHSLDEENDVRREYYGILLGNLVTVDGVSEVLLAGNDGSVYGASSGSPSAAAGLLAAFICAAAAELAESLELGAFTQFVFFGSGQPIVVFGFEEECYEFSLANGADPESVAEAVRGLLKMIG